MKKYEVEGAIALAKIMALPRQHTFLWTEVLAQTGFSESFWRYATEARWASNEYKFINPHPTSANNRLFEIKGRTVATRELVVHWPRVEARWAAIKDQFRDHLVKLAQPAAIEVPVEELRKYATAEGPVVAFSTEELKKLAAFAAT